MKNLRILTMSLIIGAFMLSMQSCGVMTMTPVGFAGLYANVTYTPAAMAVEVNANVKREKTGTAVAQNILGILNTGDCSVEAAMKQGNITRINHIDYRQENVLGLFSKLTIFVYGE
jgi:hypothetical protein